MNMKYFTPAIDKYFAAWILPDTFDTDQDLAKFHLFVYAVHHFSKPIGSYPLPLDDPSLEQYPEHLRPKFAKRTAPNPRTHDKKGMQKKILLAIKNNHKDCDEQWAMEFAADRSDKAMMYLKFLEDVKHSGFPCDDVQNWKPDIK